MAFKIPQSMQGPSVDQQQLHHALANILSHDHVGQWGSDHLQEPKSLNGWNSLAIAAIGRQAARAHGYLYQDASSRAAGVRKSAQARYGPKSLWKSLVQDGSANVVADGHWVAELVHKPNRAQSGVHPADALARLLSDLQPAIKRRRADGGPLHYPDGADAAGLSRSG